MIIGKDDKPRGLREWASYFWNRLTRILPVHYIITLVVFLTQRPHAGRQPTP